MTSLHEWQIKYINAVKDNADLAATLIDLSIAPAALEYALQNNVAFRNAVAMAQSGIGSGMLCAAELAKLREAQVSESRSAGYFGMSVDEFRKALADDPELARVYHTAPLKGQAMIQAAQFEAAISGDGDMLKWLGKNHLEQADKIETKVTVEEITDPRELAKRLAFLTAKVNMIDSTAIDITPTEENTLAISQEKSDTDLGLTE